MPSPLGHALGGVIAGCVSHALLGRARGHGAPPGAPADALPRAGWLSRVVAPWRRLPRDVRLFAWLGMAADLDFLVGRHSYESHSLGATVLVGAMVLAVRRQPRVAMAAAVAYASHILLDWLGSDTTPPLGIMALWPLNTEFYQSSLFVFDAISRRVWLWSTWVHNAKAVLGEIAMLVPLVAVALAVWPGWTQLRAVIRARDRSCG